MLSRRTFLQLSATAAGSLAVPALSFPMAASSIGVQLYTVRKEAEAILPQSMLGSLDGFRRVADQFNRWGERARAMSMRFAFHNHNYEFRRFGQTTGFEALVEQTDPKLVFFEMDCYWITQAGEDPVAM